MKFLQSGWMAALLGSALFLGVTVHLIQSHRLPRPPAAAPAPEAVGPNNSWNYKSTEVDQLIQELKQHKELLDDREKQLNELAARLQSEKTELNQITQQVRQLQLELDETIVRIKADETANLKKLAKVYAAMSPEGAAAILQEMTDDQMVKILVFMKEPETAPLLEHMGTTSPEAAKRVAEITERLRLFTLQGKPGKNPTQ